MFIRRRQGISSSQFNRTILEDEVDDDGDGDDDDDNDVDGYVTCFYLASRFRLKHFHFSFRWGVSSVIAGTSGVVPYLGHGCFFPKTFQINIHYHSPFYI
jgi:hypothetical protein